tara:strand:- start:4266 stop:5264 length:999 start_codon:yes stop_codon:yes gene_type:complete
MLRLIGLVPTLLLVFALNSPASAQGISNDDCSTATPISGLGQWFWNNAQAVSSGFDGGNPTVCALASGGMPPINDVFFQWTALASGPRQFELCANFFDSTMNVHLGGDCSAVCIEGNDYGSCGPLGISRIAIQVTAGQQYLVQLGEWGIEPFTNDFVLDVTAPALGDVVVDAIESACEPSNPNAEGGAEELFVKLPPWTTADLASLNPSGGLTGSFGMLIVGPTSVGPTPMQAYSQGLLCVSPPIGIYSPSIASSLQNPALNSLGRFDASGYDPVNNVSGDGFDLPRQLPYLGPIQEIQPGDSWSFQFWYRDRDANGAPASNLSTMAVISFL